MAILNPEDNEKTLVDQLSQTVDAHSTWPSPPPSPISSNPPPDMVASPALRAPAVPRDLLEQQLHEYDSSE